jgi:hypothetical protein
VLYHLSESPDITVFNPRWDEAQSATIVWAIHEQRLHNYLLPRECPRIGYCASENTTQADIAQFLGASRAVVAVESRWAPRVQSTQLYCYELPADTFRVLDAGAGYYVSEQAVTPLAVRHIENPMMSLLESDVELRFVPDLIAFGNRVAASTVQFSLIRMRNARSAA